jgi:hypothetical protein
LNPEEPAPLPLVEADKEEASLSVETADDTLLDTAILAGTVVAGTVAAFAFCIFRARRRTRWYLDPVLHSSGGIPPNFIACASVN